jgi:hypothetical protein
MLLCTWSSGGFSLLEPIRRPHRRPRARSVHHRSTHPPPVFPLDRAIHDRCRRAHALIRPTHNLAMQGPSRRVSFSWFESRRGAPPAADRPYVIQRKDVMRVGVLLAILMAVVVGCYPSENPIWTPETLVYYPDLLGTYQDDEPATEKNTTTLEKGEAEKSYRVITRNGKGEKVGEAVLRLVKLDETLFYDYQPTGAKLDKVEPPLKEFHIFGRITVEGKKITLYSFGSNGSVDQPVAETFRWKTVRPATAPATTRPDREATRIIANTTEELQAFLKANAKMMNVPGGGFTKLHD